MNLTGTITLKDRFTTQLQKAFSASERLGKSTLMTSRSIAGLGRVRPTVSINDQISRQLWKIRRDLRDLNSLVISPVVKVGSFGLGMIRGVVNRVLSLPGLIGMGAGAYGAVLKPLQMAGELEQTRIGFETMLGSAQKAATFIADLQKFAAKTPFEFPELQESSKLLLAFGFQAQEILPMMTALGNASAGLGKGSEGIMRAATALGQMRAKGKVSAEEMLQLTELGIPAWEMLAQKFGISTKRVQELASKGLLPVDKTIKALIEGMNKKFPNMMERQNRSLLGLWSNIKDVFNTKLIANWGEGIRQAIMPRLEQLVNWFDRNERTVEEWGRILRDAGERAANWVLTQFQRAADWLKKTFNDPEFRTLDFWGKVNFLWDEMWARVDDWLKSGGQERLNELGSRLGQFISDGLVAMAPKIASAFLGALGAAIKESPIGAFLVGAAEGYAVGTPFGLGLVGAGVGGVGGLFTHFLNRVISGPPKAEREWFQRELERRRAERINTNTTVNVRPDIKIPVTINGYGLSLEQIARRASEQTYKDLIEAMNNMAVVIPGS